MAAYVVVLGCGQVGRALLEMVELGVKVNTPNSSKQQQVSRERNETRRRRRMTLGIRESDDDVDDGISSSVCFLVVGSQRHPYHLIACFIFWV